MSAPAYAEYPADNPDLEYETDKIYNTLWEWHDRDPEDFDSYFQYTVELYESETFIEALKQHDNCAIGAELIRFLDQLIWRRSRCKAESGRYHRPSPLPH